jgi:hypothetical protein
MDLLESFDCRCSNLLDWCTYEARADIEWKKVGSEFGEVDLPSYGDKDWCAKFKLF